MAEKSSLSKNQCEQWPKNLRYLINSISNNDWKKYCESIKPLQSAWQSDAEWKLADWTKKMPGFAPSSLVRTDAVARQFDQPSKPEFFSSKGVFHSIHFAKLYCIWLCFSVNSNSLNMLMHKLDRLQLKTLQIFDITDRFTHRNDSITG